MLRPLLINRLHCLGKAIGWPASLRSRIWNPPCGFFLLFTGNIWGSVGWEPLCEKIWLRGSQGPTRKQTLLLSHVTELKFCLSFPSLERASMDWRSCLTRGRAKGSSEGRKPFFSLRATEPQCRAPAMLFPAGRVKFLTSGTGGQI